MLCFIKVFHFGEVRMRSFRFFSYEDCFIVMVLFGSAIILTFAAPSAFSQATSPPNAPAAKPKEFTFTKLEILEKPRAGYTESARDNKVEGTVKLLVTFQANGQIGEVTVVEALSHGLTERAIDAAKGIRFRPKAMNGQPMEEKTTVEYSFSLYYEDSDEDIRTRVAVLNAPKPAINPSDLPASFGGKIGVKVFFSSRGNASVFEMPSGLSADAKNKIEDAVRKIRFRPAVHRNGSRMSVTRVVTYAL